MPESESPAIGDRVLVYLHPSRWRTSGWLPGAIVRIDPYTAHRSFRWIELDQPAESLDGGRISMIAVLNPRHLRRA